VISSVRLKNYRTHDEIDLALGEGLTVIVGPNGAGKSSIFEGIAWVLHGAHAVDGVVGDIIPLGTNNKPSGSVEINGWTVERDFDGARVLNSAGKKVASSQSGVTDFVESTILNLTREESMAQIMAMQEELEWLKGKGPTERQRFVARTLSLDSLDRAQSNSRDNARDAKSRISALESVADPDEYDVEGAEEELAKHAKNMEDAKADLKKARATESAAVKEYDDASDGMVQATKIESEIEHASEAIKNSESKLERVNEEVGMIANDPVVYKPYKEELENRKKRIPEFNESLSNAKEDLERLHKAKTQLDADVRVLRNAMDSLVDPGEKCSECGNVMPEDAYNARRSEIEGDLEDAQDKLRNVEGSLKRIEEKKSDLEGTIETFTYTAERLSSLLELLKEREEITERLSGLHEKVGSAQSRLSEISVDTDRLDSLKAARNTAAARAKEAADIESEVRRKHAKAQSKLEEVRRGLEKAQAAQDDLREATRVRNLYSACSKVLGEVRDHLNSAIRARISAYASDLVSEATGGAFTRVELDEDYKPVLYIEGGPTPRMSGGESNVVAICLRIAMGRLAAQSSDDPVDMMFLDEPLESINANRQGMVVDALKSIIGDNLRQIVVVTHTQIARERADRVIELV